jgi:hypothetical protein
VIWGAFTLPWEHRGAVFRATAMPLLAVIACTLVSNIGVFEPTLASGLALSACYGIALSWLAIAVHRLVLLETPKEPERVDARSLRRLVIFFVAIVGIWILYWGLTIVIAGGVLNILSPARYVPTGANPGSAPAPAQIPVSVDWLMNAAGFMAFWVLARVSLVLPAIAIDQKPDVHAAWQTSKRNGWRLAVVVGVLPWSLQRLTDFLYRDGASTAEFGVLVVLATLFVIVEVTALSLSYWELTSRAPPPTGPPA